MTVGSWRYVRSGYGSKNADFDIVSVSTGGRIASTPYEAKARLIAAAPLMYDFVAKAAASGNAEAIAIIGAINGNA